MGWYRRGGRDYGYGGYGGFAPYVPVAKRRAKADAFAKKLAKKEGRELTPVKIEGRAIAKSFWGKAWCDNLEAYSDFANRLPRGRTYARNGSVIDLQIKKGKIEAVVSGSEIYSVVVSIDVLGKAAWRRIQDECSQSIASLIDLLQGKFDEGVMRRLAHPKDGLFPQPQEIHMKCSCPDYAGLCKHVAAVLYGVGARLDSAPEMLFSLRNVDHLELIGKAVAGGNLDRTLSAVQDDSLAGADLGEMFGIELDTAPATPKKRGRPKRAASTAPTVEKPVVEPAKRATRGKTRRRTDPLKPVGKKKAVVAAAKGSAAALRKIATGNTTKRKAR